jgi:hypothetical protein
MVMLPEIKRLVSFHVAFDCANTRHPEKEVGYQSQTPAEYTGFRLLR